MSDKRTGTKEWAETTLNFCRGCEHNCRYCYARHMLVDRFKTIEPENWPKMRVNHKVVDAPQGKKLGTVMIPSSHDITNSNINEFLCVLRKLLDSGNQVLIVSKPHWSVITVICDFYREFTDQIMFRFTIGSMNDSILYFWEPGAPRFVERLACLQYAYESGFKTSVSCEPYLDSHVDYTYMACKRFITDSFWVGKMRGFNSRCNFEGVTKQQFTEFVEPLKAAQSDSVVKSIYRLLDGQSFIRWKDSIREVTGV